MFGIARFPRRGDYVLQAFQGIGRLLAPLANDRPEGYGSRLWYLNDIFMVLYLFTAAALLYAQSTQSGSASIKGGLIAVSVVFSLLHFGFRVWHLVTVLREADRDWWKITLDIIQLFFVISIAVISIIMVSVYESGDSAILTWARTVSIICLVLSVVNYRVLALVNRSKRAAFSPYYFGWKMIDDPHKNDPKGRTFDMIAVFAQIAAFAFLIATVFVTSTSETVFSNGTEAGFTFPITLAMISLSILCHIIVLGRDFGFRRLSEGSLVAVATDFIFGTYGLWGTILSGIAISLTFDSSNYDFNALNGGLLMIGVIVTLGGIVLALASLSYDTTLNAIAYAGVYANFVNVVFTVLGVVFIITVASEPSPFTNSLNLAANTAGIGIVIAGVLSSKYKYADVPSVETAYESRLRIARRRFEKFKIGVLGIQLLGIVMLIVTDLVRQYDSEEYEDVIKGLVIATAVVLGIAALSEIVRQLTKFFLIRRLKRRQDRGGIDVEMQFPLSLETPSGSRRNSITLSRDEELPPLEPVMDRSKMDSRDSFSEDEIREKPRRKKEKQVETVEKEPEIPLKTKKERRQEKIEEKPQEN